MLVRLQVDLFDFIPENKKLVIHDFYEFDNALVVNLTSFKTQSLLIFNKSTNESVLIEKFTLGNELFVNPISKTKTHLVGYMHGEFVPELEVFFKKQKMQNTAIHKWNAMNRRGGILMLAKVRD